MRPYSLDKRTPFIRTKIMRHMIGAHFSTVVQIGFFGAKINCRKYMSTDLMNGISLAPSIVTCGR